MGKLIDLFERTLQSTTTGEPLVAITACGIFSDCLTLENQNSQLIYSRLCNVSSFTLLQQLLDVNRPKGDLKKVDGTNYGCPYTGYYDQPLGLLQKLLVRKLPP
jgi:hypothetical protein